MPKWSWEYKISKSDIIRTIPFEETIKLIKEGKLILEDVYVVREMFRNRGKRTKVYLLAGIFRIDNEDKYAFVPLRMHVILNNNDVCDVVFSVVRSSAKVFDSKEKAILYAKQVYIFVRKITDKLYTLDEFFGEKAKKIKEKIFS